MTKYVFVNVPAHGHVNPTLALVQELIARGEEVIYYLTEDFRASVEATGATFHPYVSEFTQMVARPVAWGKANQTMLPLRMVEESRNVLPQVADSIRKEKPDYIVYDMMCLWGRIIAESLHVPVVALRPSYAAHPKFNTMSRIGAQNMSQVFNPEMIQQQNLALAALCESYGITVFGALEIFSRIEDLNIIFIPRSFQPHGDDFDEHHVFVGPSIQTRNDTGDFPLEKLNGKTTIYISLGTVFNSQVKFFNTCIAAFKDMPWQVVLAYGKRIDPGELDVIPENFLVIPFAPQLAVLEHTHVFVTHAGMNSVMESLYNGVPMVALPQMPEQTMNAERVQELGLGIALDKDTVTVESLRESVKHVLEDAGCQQRVNVMQRTVREAGGYQKAADALMEYASKQRISY